MRARPVVRLGERRVRECSDPRQYHGGLLHSVAGFDWVEVSAKRVDSSFGVAVLRRLFGPEFGISRWKRFPSDPEGLRGRLEGPEGFSIRWDSVGSVGRDGERLPWVSWRLTGKACERLGQRRVRAFLREVTRLPGWNASRVDLRLDVTGLASVYEIARSFVVGGDLQSLDARLRDGVVTRCGRDSFEWRRAIGCFYIGKGTSARMLRIYDKGVESKGRLEGVRFELQSRDEWARRVVCDALAVTLRRLGSVAAAHVVSFVDVREDRGQRNKCRAPRAPWWAAVVGSAEKARPMSAPDPSSAGAWLSARRVQVRRFVRVLQAAGVDPVPWLLEDAPPVNAGERGRLDQVLEWFG